MALPLALHAPGAARPAAAQRAGAGPAGASPPPQLLLAGKWGRGGADPGPGQHALPPARRRGR